MKLPTPNLHSTAHASAGHDPHACAEYNMISQQLSRRGFMGVTGSTTMAILAMGSALPRVSFANSARGAQRDVMVSIYLRGASDGLTLCVPYADPGYYANRPTLAIPQPDSPDTLNRCTALDSFFGIPPAMMPLHQAYLDGNLLFVHACGSTDPSRSHFEAQRFMELGKPQDVTLNTGWLGRHIASVAPMDPNAILRAVGISTGLQQALAGSPNTLPIPDLDTFNLGGSSSTRAARRAALSDMYAATGNPLAAVVSTTFDTIDLLNTINFAGYVPGGGAVYPAGGFAYALKTTAALIKAQVGVEAIAIDLGGWDTHNNQGNTGTGFLAGLMGNLAGGLGAFYRDMFAQPDPGVTVAVMSEFGRRVGENASFGSDHGHGNAMMVMGACVNGGQVKRTWPGLGPGQLYQNLDLHVTTDYRDVLAEIVQNRLGNPNLPFVFPDHTAQFQGVLSC